jgi:hypothetical protein
MKKMMKIELDIDSINEIYNHGGENAKRKDNIEEKEEQFIKEI